MTTSCVRLLFLPRRPTVAGFRVYGLRGFHYVFDIELLSSSSSFFSLSFFSFLGGEKPSHVSVTEIIWEQRDGNRKNVDRRKQRLLTKEIFGCCETRFGSRFKKNGRERVRVRVSLEDVLFWRTVHLHGAISYVLRRPITRVDSGTDRKRAEGPHRTRRRTSGCAFPPPPPSRPSAPFHDTLRTRTLAHRALLHMFSLRFLPAPGSTRSKEERLTRDEGYEIGTGFAIFADQARVNSRCP